MLNIYLRSSLELISRVVARCYVQAKSTPQDITFACQAIAEAWESWNPCVAIVAATKDFILQETIKDQQYLHLQVHIHHT